MLAPTLSKAGEGSCVANVDIVMGLVTGLVTSALDVTKRNPREGDVLGATQQHRMKLLHLPSTNVCTSLPKRNACVPSLSSVLASRGSVHSLTGV